MFWTSWTSVYHRSTFTGLLVKEFIQRHIKKYLDKKITGKKDNKGNVSETQYIKLPYAGEFHGITKDSFTCLMIVFSTVNGAKQIN